MILSHYSDIYLKTALDPTYQLAIVQYYSKISLALYIKPLQ